ncbi:MAG: hypothetical protein Q4Q17_04805, partial [Tissierellia bacterium]|nr:hypothetical protein [Tissierellia bacterium]
METRHILYNFINSEDVEYFLSIHFSILRAEYNKQKQILKLFTESSDQIKSKDLDFLRNALEKKYPGIKIAIDNVEKRYEMDEQNTVEECEEESLHHSILNSIDKENDDFLSNHKKVIKEISNDKTPPKKRFAFKKQKVGLKNPTPIK